MTPVRLLIVDDSATMRALIRQVVAHDPQIQVVGEACNALEARAAIKSLNPDVITLDIEMPDMSGLDFLDRIMRLRPMPVVMVSDLTRKGADATLRAMELGAVACVGKPSHGAPDTFEQLPRVIRTAARFWHPGLRSVAADRPKSPAAATAAPRPTEVRVVALAASTGGVEALIRVLSELPPDSPPVVVVQHMPQLFTSSFAQRLDRVSPLGVVEATDGLALRRGSAVVAPGGEAHLEIVGQGALRCRLVPDAPTTGHRPSADRLFQSVASVAGAQAIGAILTGMGTDGARGLLAMRRAGAHTIGQDEATSVVFGMPKAANRMGAVAEQLPLGKVAAGITRALFTPSGQ